MGLFASVCGVALYATASLICIDHVGRVESFDLKMMFAAFALYAGCGAVIMSGPRHDRRSATGKLVSAVVVLGMLVPLAARPDGAFLARAGAWIAAAGALFGAAAALQLGRSFGIAPADRGTVSAGPYRLMRHPMVVSFALICAGYLLVRWSAWNASVLAAAVAVAAASAFWEERLLRPTGEYQAYSERVRWRFVPWIL